VSEFRCTEASRDDDEPLAGTAPTETDWLFVEDLGPWPAKATGHLSGLAAQTQLIRRFDRRTGSGIQVFRADLAGVRPLVTAATLTSLDDLGDLAATDLAPYDGPLWFVCTNGKRDVCCAERGRPVTAALADRWPEATWETTHLGGHRLSATLLALPAGHTLGRLGPASAVAACAALETGQVDLDLTRGRTGWPGRAQWADLQLRREHGWTGLDDVRLAEVAGDRVVLDTPLGERVLVVTVEPGEPRRQSCADLKTKPAPVFTIRT